LMFFVAISLIQSRAVADMKLATPMQLAPQFT